MGWVHMTSGLGLVVCSCEHGNKLWGSINGKLTWWHKSTDCGFVTCTPFIASDPQQSRWSLISTCLLLLLNKYWVAAWKMAPSVTRFYLFSDSNRFHVTLKYKTIVVFATPLCWRPFLICKTLAESWINKTRILNISCGGTPLWKYKIKGQSNRAYRSIK